MNIIQLSTNGAYIKIDNSGAHAVYKPTPRQGGALFCGFKPQIGSTDSLAHALTYCGVNKKERARAMAVFAIDRKKLCLLMAGLR